MELAIGTFAHFPRCEDQPLHHHISSPYRNQLRNYQIPIGSMFYPSWKSKWPLISRYPSWWAATMGTMPRRSHQARTEWLGEKWWQWCLLWQWKLDCWRKAWAKADGLKKSEFKMRVFPNLRRIWGSQSWETRTGWKRAKLWGAKKSTAAWWFTDLHFFLVWDHSQKWNDLIRFAPKAWVEPGNDRVLRQAVRGHWGAYLSRCYKEAWDIMGGHVLLTIWHGRAVPARRFEIKVPM